MPEQPNPLPLITRILQRQGADPDLLPAMAAKLADQLGPHATLDTIAWTVRRLLDQHPEYKAPPAPATTAPPAATLELIQPGMTPEARRAVAEATNTALQELGQLPPPPDTTGPPVDLNAIHKGMSDQEKEAARKAISRALE